MRDTGGWGFQLIMGGSCIVGSPRRLSSAGHRAGLTLREGVQLDIGESYIEGSRGRLSLAALKYTQHFPNKKNSFTFMFHPNDRWLILYVLQLAYSILGGFIFRARQTNPVLRGTHESRFLCK